jgi:GntR family transcriptional regulator, transcriptional repressor for pyruvate dehydrogenase complex
VIVLSDIMMNSPAPLPLLRASLPDQVVLTLLRQIVAGELSPGAPLPTEHALGERFAVSRTVVREAIRTLVSKGLVEVRHGRGMRVAPAWAWDPLDTDIMRVRFERGEFGDTWWQFTEARMVFEADTAALAAGRRDETDLAALADALGRMRAATDAPEQYRIADIDFHASVMRAAHNPILVRILEPVHLLLMAGGMRQPTAFAVGPALRSHGRVFDAIRLGDCGAAREAMATLFPTYDPSQAGSRPVMVSTC